MASPRADNSFLHHSQLFDVSHITAVVTGAGGGLGLMMVQALVANGAKVYGVDRREDALRKVVDLYNTGPGEIIPLAADISSKLSIETLSAKLTALQPDGIQLLINHAGITSDDVTRYDHNGKPDLSDAQSISSHYMRSTPELWTTAFSTNVVGGFFMSMALLPLLVRGHDAVPGYTSSIINVTSNSALLKHTTHGHISYAASKAAFLHLSKMLSTTLALTRVRVNALAPGIFPTAMTAGTAGEDGKSELREMAMPNILKRPGREEDIAATVLLLAGKGGVYYYGQLLWPDGGEMLTQPTTI